MNLQSFFMKIFVMLGEFLSPGNIKKILWQLKGYWNHVDITGKLVMTLLFAPSIVVLFWMLGYIAYIVVFTLPGIVLTIIAQVFLFGIFWSAAVYVYEKLHGTVSEKVTVEPPEEEKRSESEGGSVRWRKRGL